MREKSGLFGDACCFRLDPEPETPSAEPGTGQLWVDLGADSNEASRHCELERVLLGKQGHNPLAAGAGVQHQSNTYTNMRQERGERGNLIAMAESCSTASPRVDISYSKRRTSSYAESPQVPARGQQDIQSLTHRHSLRRTET